MKLAVGSSIAVAFHVFGHLGLYFHSLVHKQGATGLDEGGVVAETLQIGLLGAVDVEMVGVGGGDDGGPRAQPVERTVILIGLYHHIVAVAQEIVGAVVFQNASQKGVAAQVAVVHDVGAHRRGSGLAVCACHAESAVRAGQRAEHLGAFLHFETALSEPVQLLVCGRHGRGVYHQGRFGVPARFWYALCVVFVVYLGAFLLQFEGERSGCLVVSCHKYLLVEEESCDGAHADAAHADKIDCLYIVQVHVRFQLLVLVSVGYLHHLGGYRGGGVGQAHLLAVAAQ